MRYWMGVRRRGVTVSFTSWYARPGSEPLAGSSVATASSGSAGASWPVGPTCSTSSA